jgi:hypothetical protein
MDGTGHILFLLSQGGISSAVLRNVPAGELITLARTNSAIRAELHYFGQPHPHPAITQGIRQELQIGHHDTTRWKRLKANAPYECSSSTHTKGTDVKPCRYCSKLICGGCMTRASFAFPGEKTFQNRCRSFCESCWMSGNRHQRQKLTDDCDCHQHEGTSKAKGTQENADQTKTCECTNKNDGWVCLECKHLQNKVWPTKDCFGEGCSNPLDSAAERRKICMWCDKPLPITATRENPHVYKQKVVDAMAQEAASRQADLEAHTSRRRKRLRMSLRELRGDEAVSSNPQGDDPILVRHLDTVNYSHLLGFAHSFPTPSQVYNSKLGRWQYSRSFLLSFRSRCDSIIVPSAVKDATRSSHPTIPERTNSEVFAQFNKERRAEQQRQTWEAHRGQIVRMYQLEMRSVKEIQDTIFKEHGLWDSTTNYHRRLNMWQGVAVATGVGGARQGLSRPVTDRDLPIYWRDVGPAGDGASEGNDTIGEPHDGSPTRQPFISSPYNAATAAPGTTRTAPRTATKPVRPLPQTLDQNLRTGLTQLQAPSLGRGISQIQSEVRFATTGRRNWSENREARFRREVDEMEEDGGGYGDNTTGRGEGLQSEDHQRERSGEEEDADTEDVDFDQDEINLQIAILESLTAHDAMGTDTDTNHDAMQPDTEEDAMNTSTDTSSSSETPIETQRRIQQQTEAPKQQSHNNDITQAASSSHVGSSARENQTQNTSQPDGRPPEYFA